jgi:hypothetical protein
MVSWKHYVWKKYLDEEAYKKEQGFANFLDKKNSRLGNRLMRLNKS